MTPPAAALTPAIRVVSERDTVTPAMGDVGGGATASRSESMEFDGNPRDCPTAERTLSICFHPLRGRRASRCVFAASVSRRPTTVIDGSR